MRKIVTAISAAALALSMVAQSAPAAAVVGFDSSYAGESAFVFLAQGQSNEFQVFFANTGTTTWTQGTATQVDLAACLEDKTTCNAQDASEAPWNPGTWLSAVRYATHSQVSVAPGQIGTFRYTVTAPANAVAGTYRFNGDLVLSITGERIHPQGYFQDATISTTAQAATINSLTPNSGTISGGTTVTIAGSNFVCTPAFPTVNFGSNTGTVTSCGATQVVVSSPAASALGAVTVTVTNAGAGPSNGLTFTYTDTTKPTYGSVAVAGSVATVTFSEPVCRNTAWAAGDWEITVNGIDHPDTADSAPICNATSSNAVNSFNIFFGPAAPNGAFVAVTLLTGASIEDVSGNTANAPRTNTATATSPETTAPTITSASGLGNSSTITVNFSEPVYCQGITGGEFVVTATGQTTRTGTSTTCPTTPQTAASSFTVALSGPLTGNVTYTLTVTTTANEIQDVQGNDLASPATTTFTTGAADTTPPTLTDTRATANVVSTDFDEDGDTFTITFSETMSTASGSIQISDGNGSTATITCGGGGNANCTWNSTATVLTVEFTANLTVTESTGSTPGIQLPATIETMTGFSDASGNVPNLAGSADRIIDFE